MVERANLGLNTNNPHVRLLRGKMLPLEMTKEVNVAIVVGNRGVISTKRLQTMVVFDRDQNGGMQMWYSDQPGFTSVRKLENCAEFQEARASHPNIVTGTEEKEMWLVPLSSNQLETRQPWLVSKDLDTLSGAIQSLFLTRSVLGTVVDSTDTSTAVWYALMGINRAYPALSRTGVLFIKGPDGFYPITWKSKQGEFLVEVKGLGNPTGIYDTHSRLSGEHHTGYIKQAEALGEFMCSQLMQNHSARFQRGHAVRPLMALAPQQASAAGASPLSYCWRLAPTNRRASWSGNPIFPDMAAPEIAKDLAFALGETVGELAALPQPFFHGASHPENLLLFSPHAYCLTDFSNSVPASLVPPEEHWDRLASHAGAIRQINGYTEGECEHRFLDGFTLSLLEAERITAEFRTRVLAMSDPNTALKTVAEQIAPHLSPPIKTRPSML